jgi:hypothetical protein
MGGPLAREASNQVQRLTPVPLYLNLQTGIWKAVAAPCETLYEHIVSVGPVFGLG